MPSSTILGTYKHQAHIERACLATLQKWMRSYIGLAEQAEGFPAESLPDIKGWARKTQVDLGQRPEEHIPLVAVTAGDTTDVRRDGDGSYDAAWALQVSVVVMSAEEDDTRDMGALYAYLVRKVLTEQPWVAGHGPDPAALFPVDCKWTGDQPETIAASSARTIFGTHCLFHVYTDGVMTTADGPTTPEPLPDPPGGGRPDYPDAPTAETVAITVDQTS